MPNVNITYDVDEVRSLIQKDIERRFGVVVPDHEIDPSFSVEGQWSASVDKGKIDAANATDCREG